MHHGSKLLGAQKKFIGQTNIAENYLQKSWRKELKRIVNVFYIKV